MALIRVRLAGICSTDLQIFKGYMGFQGVPGHEFVGEVKEGPSELVGKRPSAAVLKWIEGQDEATTNMRGFWALSACIPSRD